ncbi:MAG: serine/threonine-protein kinase [Bryobacteraceae bacterium]
MAGAHWTRIQNLFLEASDLPKAERERLLEREASDDPEVRKAVESLLFASDQMGGFLTQALGEAAVAAVKTAEGKAPQAGDRFGAYEWKRALGEGGMGSVFLAERADGAYRKQVAIKVVRAGLDTPAARERFRAERQTLARLEHGNVARLLEGGETGDGLPYVVMEYIDGVPIDEYCRTRGLGIGERIGLFQQVCAGVGYAHRNLVVHRDLKPANILVTADGVVKLVDFGIAKSLHAEDAALTRAGDRAMTPSYASPEQILGQPVTPASDVYALGVVLYELLTGSLPYDLKGATAGRIEKAICEEEPPRASAAAAKDGKRLRGDLDNIIAKAMRKDAGLRYESVEALSADLGRYLQGFPVQAAPLSVGYRTKKFLARNRWGVAAAAVFVVAVIGFMVTLVKERNTANRERDKAEQVAKFLAESFRAASPEESRGRVVTARDILDRGASRINKELASQPDVRATLLRTIGVVYSSIAEYKRGVELVGQAVKVRAEAAAKEAVQPEELVRDAMSEGGVRFVAGDGKGGVQRMEEALQMQERLAPGNQELRGSLLLDLGRMYARSRNYDAAEKTLAQAIEARKKGGDEAKLAEAYSGMADLYTLQAKYDRAIELELQMLAVLRRHYGELHPDVISCYSVLSRSYHDSGRHDEAVRYAEKAVEAARKVYGPDHPALAIDLSNLGMAYTQAGRFEDSLKVHEEGLAIRRKTKAQRADLTGGLSNLARAYQNLGRHDRFYTLIKETLEVAREENEDNPVPLNNWGVAQRQQGELTGALRTMEEALARAGKMYAKGHVNLAHYRSNLALVLMDLGRYREAERRLEEGREILGKKLPARHWLLYWNDALRAECRLAAQDVAGARKLAEEALAALEKDKQATVTAAMGVMGRVHLAQGEVEQAVQVLRQLVEMERKPSAFHDAFTVAYAEGWLAKALRKAGRVEEAGKLRASAEAVLGKYPDHARLRAAVRD